jgi:hypothetical protein
MSRIRLPIQRVRREGGRVVTAPEMAPVVLLRQVMAGETKPDGTTTRTVVLRMALKVLP